MSRSNGSPYERILVADSNGPFREGLAEQLRASGFEVVTAATGESAFHLLRHSGHWIDWLYTRADLPGLIDGWILADAYRDSHPDRTAVIAASSERVSSQGHAVLKEPSLRVARDVLYAVATAQTTANPADADPLSLAA